MSEARAFFNTIVFKLGDAKTDEEIREVIDSDPEFKQSLQIDNAAFKYKVRGLLNQKYGKRVTNNVIMPASKRGAPKKEKTLWSPLGNIVVRQFDEAKFMPVKILDSTADDWTCERVKTAGDMIVNLYKNESTASNLLSRFRKILESLGVRRDITFCSSHPETTKVHNERMQERQKELIEEGIEVPEQYKDLDKMIERIDEFVAGNHEPTAITAADLMVSLSCRPGEVSTLQIGPHGKITGVLKKRGEDIDKEYNLVSAIGLEKATAFLNKWRSFLPEQRRYSMDQLKHFIKTMKIQMRHLRMIGAYLSAKVAQENGEIKNEAQLRNHYIKTLRHNEPRMAAVDHYLKINNSPVEQIPESIEVHGESSGHNHIVEMSDSSDSSNTSDSSDGVFVPDSSENDLIFLRRFKSLSSGDRSLIIAMMYRMGAD
jgi:hypothetical protein